MKPIIIFIPVLALLVLTACNNPQTQKTAEVTEDVSKAVVVKPAFTHVDTPLTLQVQHIYEQYLQLKDALVSEKGDATLSHAKDISQLISAFDDTTISADQKQAYDQHSAAIRQLAARISNETNIEKQRAAFASLSDHVFELVKTFGNLRPVYQEHCPMAFDGKGASWLSDKPVIRNPYYGDKMLECGEVITIVK